MIITLTRKGSTTLLKATTKDQAGPTVKSVSFRSKLITNALLRKYPSTIIMKVSRQIEHQKNKSSIVWSIDFIQKIRLNSFHLPRNSQIIYTIRDMNRSNL